jgi:hypothetical protein
LHATATHVLQAEVMVGAVQVSLEPLIKALQPEPLRCIKAIHSLVPELASRKHESFMSEVVAATTKLHQEPTSVSELAEHVTFVAEIVGKRAALDAAFDAVQEQYGLCKVCFSLLLLHSA